MEIQGLWIRQQAIYYSESILAPVLMPSSPQNNTMKAWRYPADAAVLKPEVKTPKIWESEFMKGLMAISSQEDGKDFYSGM